MNPPKFLLLFFLALFSCNGSHPGKIDSSTSDSSKPDSLFFKSLVTQYTESISKADTSLGAKLWSHVDQISFINPRGHEHGWDSIKTIYNMFRDNFSERKLTFHNLKTSVYNDFAWLEFYWVFDAVIKADNSKVQTRGRETQIWRKTDDGWRLIHVHYSGMPERGIN
jgi:ketosteroid isomerase-like protein